MIDYVYIPDLRCLRCGKITALATRQTCINKEPHSDGYTLGSRFDLPDDVEGFEGGDYLPTRPDLVIGERLRVLEVWYCGHCGVSSLCVWSFANEVLVEARLVEMSPSIFAEVDLVTNEIDTAWLHEALLELYPDDAEGIEFLSLRECIQVVISAAERKVLSGSPMAHSDRGVSRPTFVRRRGHPPRGHRSHMLVTHRS